MLDTIKLPDYLSLRHLSFSPDSIWVAATVTTRSPESPDAHVLFIHRETGTVASQITVKNRIIHSQEPTFLAGPPVFLGGVDGEPLRMFTPSPPAIWDVPSGIQLMRLSDSELRYVAVSQDRKVLAGAGRNEITLWHLRGDARQPAN